MKEQQSQKRGVRSAAQKEERARDAYAPVPPSKPVAGAFGKGEPETPFEEELSLSYEERLAEQKRIRNS